MAFRSEREGGGIFIMPVTGGSLRRLTDFGHNPAWSPDAKEILAPPRLSWIQNRGPPQVVRCGP
ncbi:MAG: hypothetical protein HY238_05375 [Acidobacteria bacterium]|nr:hypothetical protein [Acidobacteriota bacterium]